MRGQSENRGYHCPKPRADRGKISCHAHRTQMTKNPQRANNGLLNVQTRLRFSYQFYWNGFRSDTAFHYEKSVPHAMHSVRPTTGPISRWNRFNCGRSSKANETGDLVPKCRERFMTYALVMKIPETSRDPRCF